MLMKPNISIPQNQKIRLRSLHGENRHFYVHRNAEFCYSLRNRSSFASRLAGSVSAGSNAGDLQAQTSSASLISAASVASDDVLPSISQDARLATAKIKQNGVEIYIVGISHVSKASCFHIREVIKAVKPDTVVIELCKDRAGLLLDETTPPQLWHTQKLAFPNYSPGYGWPSEVELKRLLKSNSGDSLTLKDIEDDVVMLLSTGLFSSVQPRTTPPQILDAPRFVRKRGGRIQTAAPLGAVEFYLTPRKLPEIKEITIEVCAKDLDVDSSVLEGICKTLREKSKSNSLTLDVLMHARAEIYKLLKTMNKTNRFSTSFSGIESGFISVQIVESSNDVHLTGLESTAHGGKGIGIQPFHRRSRQSTENDGGWNFKLGTLTEENSSDSESKIGNYSEHPIVNEGNENLPEFVPYSPNEFASNQMMLEKENDFEMKNDIIDRFAQFLTRKYGELQASAGRRVGVSPGQAWRIAVEEAVACGSTQILMGDQPSSITGRNLAKGLWNTFSLWLVGASVSGIVSGFIGFQIMESREALAVGIFGALIPVSAAVFSLVAPLQEVESLSKLSPTGIEEAVKVKESLQGSTDPYFLWGEDALLKWPGALSSVLESRDAFMVTVLQAATNSRTNEMPPAFIQTYDGSTINYKYSMPGSQCDPHICPPGIGEGTYTPAQAKRIVAIVGTAHVRGMLELLAKSES